MLEQLDIFLLKSTTLKSRPGFCDASIRIKTTYTSITHSMFVEEKVIFNPFNLKLRNPQIFRNSRNIVSGSPDTFVLASSPFFLFQILLNSKLPGSCANCSSVSIGAANSI